MRTPYGKPWALQRSKQAQERLSLEIAKAKTSLCLLSGQPMYMARIATPGARSHRRPAQELPSLIDGGRHNAGLAHVDNVVDILIRSAPATAIGAFTCLMSQINWSRYLRDLARMAAQRSQSIPMP